MLLKIGITKKNLIEYRYFFFFIVETNHRFTFLVAIIEHYYLIFFMLLKQNILLPRLPRNNLRVGILYAQLYNYKSI